MAEDFVRPKPDGINVAYVPARIKTDARIRRAVQEGRAALVLAEPGIPRSRAIWSRSRAASS
jgi:hypothetical protein